MGPALGPPLGGYLVDNYSWNWCFDINVLPGIVSTLLLLALLRDPTAPRRTPVDVTGLLLLATTISTMQYVLTEGERHYWFADATIKLMSLLCVGTLAAFIWWELRRADVPIVDLRILKNRSVASGSILAFVLGAVIFGSTYVLPQLTQGPLGYTPLLSGQLFILRAIPIAICTPFVARLSGTIDTRWLLGVGFVVMAVGMGMQARITTTATSFWQFGPPLVLVGLAGAMLFVPISIAVLGATSPSDGPKAGAMINLATQLGGSVLIALLDVVIDRRMSFHSVVLGGSQTLASPQTVQFLTQGGTLAQLSQLVNTQALVLAFADATYAMMLIAFLCIPLVFLMRRPKPARHAALEVGG
jgi:DHA2 family multidrug resistance protein